MRTLFPSTFAVTSWHPTKLGHPSVLCHSAEFGHSCKLGHSIEFRHACNFCHSLEFWHTSYLGHTLEFWHASQLGQAFFWDGRKIRELGASGSDGRSPGDGMSGS